MRRELLRRNTMKVKRLLAALTALMLCLSVTVQPALADYGEEPGTVQDQTVQPVEEETPVIEKELAEEAEVASDVEEPQDIFIQEEPDEEEKTLLDEETVAAEEPETDTVDGMPEESAAAFAVQPLAETAADANITEVAVEDQPAVQDVGGVQLNDINFPDAAFRTVASGFDKDGDGTLSQEEIAEVTSIKASGKGISDLTGIEHFTALQALEVADNQLTSLNISALTKLEMLWADNNKLTTLDLSANLLSGGQQWSATENALTQITLPAAGRFDWEAKVGNQRLPSGKERGYLLKWYTDSSYGNPLQLADGVITCSGQTLYGRAEAIQYTLTFSAGSESVTGKTDDLQATYDQNVQLPVCGFVPTDSEREFAGWKLGGVTYSANQEVKNLTDRDGATLELVAQWRYKDYSHQQYSITLYGDGGQQETFQANYGTDAVITTNLNKGHYHLVGWARQEGGPVWLKADNTISYARPSLLQAALGQQPALYAVWEIDRHTVTFAGIDPAPKAVTVDYGSTIALPAAPQRTGYVFEGWYTDSDTVWNQQSNVVEKDMTLTARYRAARFTVKFDGNGADSGAMSEMQFTYNQAQDLTRNNYTLQWHDFDGWSFTPNGQAVVMDEADASRLAVTDGGTVTLYAVWKRQQTDVTVTINGEQQQYKTGLGAALAIPAPQRTGWRFTGWLDEQGNPWQADTVVTAPLNLTASFEPIEYSVVFNGNGADNAKAMENAKFSLTYEQKTDLPTNRYTRAGYTFLGWSRTPGGRVEYGDGVSVGALTAADGAQVVLYAVWQGLPVTESSNVEQGSSDEKPASAGAAALGEITVPTAVVSEDSAVRSNQGPIQNAGQEQPGAEAEPEELPAAVLQEPAQEPDAGDDTAPAQLDGAPVRDVRSGWVYALALGAMVLLSGGAFAAVYTLMRFKKQ